MQSSAPSGSFHAPVAPGGPVPSGRLKFVHLNYHHHQEFQDPHPVIKLHKFSSGFIDPLAREVDFLSVKHLDHAGDRRVDGIPYHFFRSRNRSWHIPFRTHRFIAAWKPDVVLTEGFVFPLQVIDLRRRLPRHCRILAQHQGERPWQGIKGRLQQMADRCIDAYLFTSGENAQPWIGHGVIRDPAKVHEVYSASTALRPVDRDSARRRLNIRGHRNFLWVGRLIDIKDPLTVLRAFAKYARQHPDAHLHFIYQDDHLLPNVREMILSERIADQVHLLGRVANEDLNVWYSACDCFVLGSHREGSGYALVEAMACGCFPIVTDIPSFRKLSGDGRLAFLFPPGDEAALLHRMQQLHPGELPATRQRLIRYVQDTLSFEAIARQLLGVCRKLRQA